VVATFNARRPEKRFTDRNQPLKTRVGFVPLKLSDGVINRHKRMVLNIVPRVNLPFFLFPALTTKNAEQEKYESEAVEMPINGEYSSLGLKRYHSTNFPSTTNKE